MGTWHDPDVGRPIAAPLERCAELLGVDLATVRELAANVEPYLRADGTRIWSLMQLERQLRPQAYGTRRGGYRDRRRNPTAPSVALEPPDGPTVLDDSAGSIASALMEALTPMVGIMESPRSTTRPRGAMGDRPTEPIPPTGGWGQPPFSPGPPGGWGVPPPPRPPRQPNHLPWWRRPWAAGLIWGVIGFVAGAAAGGAGAEQEPRTVTVTSIVTSIVPASTTTTTEPPTTTEPEPTTTVRATTTTRRPRPATTTTTRRRVTTTTRAPTRNCHPSYPDFCIPPPPPDLDCPDIGETDFTVQGTDPHGFDADNDGVGCES